MLLLCLHRFLPKKHASHDRSREAEALRAGLRYALGPWTWRFKGTPGTQWSIVHTRSLSSFTKNSGNTDSDRQSDPHAIFAGFSARRFTAMNKAKDVISTGDTMVTKVMKVGFSVCGLLTPRRSAAHSPARKYKHLPGHRVA